GRGLPRLLPRRLRDGSGDQRGAHPGPPVARRGCAHRARRRSRPPGRQRARLDVTASQAGTPSPAVSRRLLPDTSSVSAEGRLSVGGVDVIELAEQVGTPLFVYDEVHLRARCREAVEAWGDGVAYAGKAFLCKAMAALAYEEGMWLDVATAGELYVALAAGVPAGRLVLHGNNKSEDELAYAVEVGVGRIVVDSFDEIDRLQ